jgi:hypothetical protein
MVGDDNLILQGTPTAGTHPPAIIQRSSPFIFVPSAAGIPATVSSDVQILTIQPQSPTIIAAVQTDIDVSESLSILLAALGPTVQAGATVRQATPQDLVIQPQGPSIQAGASVFVDPVSLILQSQDPNIETGASAVVEDPQGILISPQGPLVSGGAQVSVSEAGIIRITVPGPLIQASTAIGAEVERPVTLTLCPLGPTIGGARAQRYSVHRGKGTRYSKGTRDHVYDVGNFGVSTDSEDFE